MTAAADSLQSVVEAWLTLNHLTTSIHALVGPVELEGQTESDQDNQTVGDHAGDDSWAIAWKIGRAHV